MTIPQVIAAIFLAIGVLNNVGNMHRAAKESETPVKFSEALRMNEGLIGWLLILWWGGFWA